MKHLFILFLLLLSNSFVSAQNDNIRIEITKSRNIVIKNISGFTLKFTVFDDEKTYFDDYILPGKNSTVPYQFPRRIMKKLNIAQEYDLLCLEIDKQIIEHERSCRKAAREADIIVNALITTARETIKAGFIGKAIDIAELGSLAINNRPADEWITKFGEIAVSEAISQQLPKSWQVGLVYGLFELSKLLEEEEYPDLEAMLVNIHEVYISGVLNQTNPFVEVARFIPYDPILPALTFTAGVPLKNTFSFDSDDDLVGKYSTSSEIGNQLPLALKLSMRGEEVEIYLEYRQFSHMFYPRAVDLNGEIGELGVTSSGGTLGVSYVIVPYEVNDTGFEANLRGDVGFIYQNAKVYFKGERGNSFRETEIDQIDKGNFGMEAGLNIYLGFNGYGVVVGQKVFLPFKSQLDDYYFSYSTLSFYFPLMKAWKSNPKIATRG